MAAAVRRGKGVAKHLAIVVAVFIATLAGCRDNSATRPTGAQMAAVGDEQQLGSSRLYRGGHPRSLLQPCLEIAT